MHKHKWEWTPFWHRYTCQCGKAQPMKCKAAEEMTPCDCDLRAGMLPGTGRRSVVF
jgi:hypothetical protein